MACTLDTKVGDTLKDTHAVDILEKHIPGVARNPMIGFAEGMTIQSLLEVPPAKQYGITEDKVQNMLAEMNGRK
jgi:hypothetical protein